MDSSMDKTLDYLEKREYVQLSELSDLMSVSEKTARTRLKEWGEMLRQHGAKLEKKRGSGYRLHILDETAYQEWRKLETNNQIPSTPKERVMFLLSYLLNREEYIRLEDLEAIMYMSRNTVTADLGRVEYILSLYQLSIRRQPKYGILIEGTELDKRRCIAYVLMRSHHFIASKEEQQREQRTLAKLLGEEMHQLQLKVSENALDSLVVYIYVALWRIRRGQRLELTTSMRKEITQNLSELALPAAEQIAERMENVFQLSFAGDETLYFALQLSGKLSSDSPGKYGSNLVISSEMDELVLRMLMAIFETNRLDFRRDMELRMSLNQHMVPLDIRMRYGIPLKNSLLEQVKKKYVLAYAVASTACAVLSDYYKKPVPEDEIGYIAILFALAIEKKNHIVTKKNIVIVCASGRGSAQLFLYKYRKAFGEYLDKIYECSVYDLENFDFSEIDYVFTTIPLQIHVPVPVFEISMFVDELEVNRYRRMFELGDSYFLRRFYQKELFISGLRAETKEEALTKLCQFVEKKRKLPEGFLASVMEREEMGQTDFGNLTAIPHPAKVMTPDSFVAVAVLYKPVWWGHHDVQLILLISMAQEEEMEHDVGLFYEITTDFLSNEKKIKAVLQNPNFETLLEQLLG